MKTTTSLVRLAFGTALFVILAMLLATSSADRMSASEHLGAPKLAEQDPDDCLPKDPPPPVVKVKVRVPARAETGQHIEYRICVENCSTSEAHHVMVKDQLPGNVKFVKSDPAPTKQGSELQWNLGTIGGGAVREIILTVQATNKEDIKNCVRVQFEHGVCLTTRLSALPPGAKPPIITTVPDKPLPTDAPILDLSVVGPKSQYSNLPAKYEITLTNTGKTKATNTQVSVRLPDMLKVVKASDPGVAVENVVAWNLGHLEPGATRRLELTLKATDKGEFCFKAMAEADLGLKKEVEFCTKFAGVSAMTIEMIDREDPVFLGHKTSYPVVIRNQGTEPVTNTRLRAFIPEGLKLEKTSPPLLEKREPIKGGEWIEFRILPKIEVGEQAPYEIFVEGIQAGVTRFHIEITADQLETGPVIEQESTSVVDDREKLKVKELSRTR